MIKNEKINIFTVSGNQDCIVKNTVQSLETHPLFILRKEIGK